MLGFAAPLIFIGSFFANIIFLRLLKYKLLYIYQRPTPKNAKSLESFNFFIQFIGTVSIITNSIVFGITLMGFVSPAEIQSYESQSKILKYFNKKLKHILIKKLILMLR